ncbi:hydrogenase small subunit [Trichloromonas acetexigens]|uniref:Hydrogenase small subunit n=1 Tax=Trichloromonas acetexigens TaxID=38815 RepID=A0A550JGT1_9BACT|nr:hydrogenase small subunit [Desulfuromonas acetexigens]TRO82401.1 hydrogenase small subunit [Desulfuromonas acetexigens]
MPISRRRFLQFTASGAAVLGVSLFGNPLLRKAFASAIQETPIIWLAAGACSGCSVSLLNSLSPRIQDVLLDQILPGHHLELAFHPTVMAASGDLAMQAMYDTEEKPFILVVEGSITTADGGRHCEIGEKDGHGITSLEHVTRLGRKAKAVIAIGSCAAFGGIPAANMNPTGSKGVMAVFKEQGIVTPTINLPGCAVHPDWFIGTVAAVLLGGPESVKVDAQGRPEMFYQKLIHDNCPLRGHFDAGRFAEKFGDPYCLYKLGCKGPVAHANCPEKRFNSGTNWCIDNGHPCQGCVEPEYPFDQTMWGTVPIKDATPPSLYPPIVTDLKKSVDVTPAYAALAGVAAGVVGAQVLKKKPARHEDSEGKE